jgi:general secretion pathway protein N
VGTIIGGHRRIAIFVDQSLTNSTRIHDGERIDGWTLRSVDPRSVVLELNGQTIVLGLPNTAAKAGYVKESLAPRASPPRPALRASAVARNLKRLHPIADGL